MDVLFFLIGSIVLIASIVLFVINKVKKTKNKNALITFVVSIIAFVISFSLILSNPEYKKKDGDIQSTIKDSMSGNFQEDIKGIANGTFLEMATNESNKVTLVYTYSNDKAKDYFETGDKINKVLMEDPYRVIRYYPDVNEVVVIIKSQEREYLIDISKSELEDFLGLKISKIKSSDDWREKVVNKIFTKEKRADFINKYVN